MVDVADTLRPHVQSCVDRFARALLVPSKLLALHPRKQGHAGNAQALPAAIVLGVIAAFEGFSEDVLATALHLQGYSFAQVVKRANLTNPDIKEMAQICAKEFPGVVDRIGVDVQIEAYRPLRHGEGTWWKRDTMTWDDINDQGEGWMQVRHCLTHGLATGWRSEKWPGPVRKDKSPASSVLRQKGEGQHSLGLDGAITCARVYRTAAEHFSDVLASECGQRVKWGEVPEFPL